MRTTAGSAGAAEGTDMPGTTMIEIRHKGTGEVIRQVEAASLEWLEKHDVPRDTLVQLMLGGLSGTLVTAKILDPDAPFVPP